jgi:hypothetical protein
MQDLRQKLHKTVFVTSQSFFSFLTKKRSDLLGRHTIIHGVNDQRRRPTGDSPSNRVTSACAACSKAKVRCSNTRPCERCASKGMPCDANMPPVATASSPREYVHIDDWVPNNSSMYQQNEQQHYGFHDAQMQDRFPIEQTQRPANTILDSNLPHCDRVGQLHTQIADVYPPSKWVCT